MDGETGPDSGRLRMGCGFWEDRLLRMGFWVKIEDRFGACLARARLVCGGRVRLVLIYVVI